MSTSPPLSPTSSVCSTSLDELLASFETSNESPPAKGLIHLLVNHSLSNVYVIMDSCEAFIEFMKRIYGIFDYEYEVVPLPFEVSSLEEWKEFCSHCETEWGKEIPYDRYVKEPLVYQEGILSYEAAYYTFYRKRKHVKGLFSLNASVEDVNKKAMFYSGRVIKTLTESMKTMIDNAEESRLVWEKATKGLPTPKPRTVKPNPIPVKDNTYWYGTVEMYNVASHYYNIHQDAEDAEFVVPERVRTIVVYDDTQTTTLVIQGKDGEWVSKWISLVGGITILKDYEGLSTKDAEKVMEYFHQRPFVDGADAQEHMNSFDLLHHLSKKRSEVELQIQSYLTRNYTMSKDGKKLMKASVLQERIETALSDSTIGNQPIIESAIADTLSFRKLISAVLLEMGLQKKRLSDGIYYYGIEPKIPRELAMSTALETLTREREQHKEILMKHWATLPKKSE